MSSGVRLTRRFADAALHGGRWLLNAGVPDLETGLWAVVVQLSAPQSVPGSSIDFQNTRSGLPFLRLMTDLGRRDVVWLLPLTD